MPWPKGYTRKQVLEMPEAERKALFAGRTVKAEPEVSASIPEPVKAPAQGTPKAKPKNLFSGKQLKLQVYGKNFDDRDPIPGYRLYWFNDTEGGLRIAQAEASGWQFVQKDEVALNDGQVTPGNNDLGNKVRRWVSTQEGGVPVYAFLMKKPRELDEEHQAEREQLHQQIETALRAGTFNMTGNERRYTAERPPIGSPSGLPPINISSKIAR